MTIHPLAMAHCTLPWQERKSDKMSNLAHSGMERWRPAGNFYT